jgi:hypothetical protein
MEPVGPVMEFMLGSHGFLGGGGIGVRVPEGHAFTASGHFFGQVPYVISWTGVVAEEVERIEVRLADERTRDVQVHEGPTGFPRYFWFFPPRGVPAEIVAYGGGVVLERQALPEPEVPADANVGTGVNPWGWRSGGPPPGWPEDAREFAPGEGPRREEDFLLHISPFPIFVVPPDDWEGLASLGGHQGHGNTASYVPTQIEFEYLDRPGEPTRGMHVVNVDPEEEDHLEKVYAPHREEDVWWFDAGDDAAYLPQLPGRFRDAGDDAVERDVRSAWGRRYLGQGGLVVIGTDVVFERWEYWDHPELSEIRFRLPRVALRVEGWNLSLDELCDFAARLEHLELGSDLLRRMTESAAAATAAWGLWVGER